MNQKDKIILYMNRHGSITKRQGYYIGIGNLGARIGEMRADGIPIKTEMKEVTNADGSTSRIAVYSFDGGDKHD